MVEMVYLKIFGSDFDSFVESAVLLKSDLTQECTHIEQHIHFLEVDVIES
jgi:hypothetical protein